MRKVVLVLLILVFSVPFFGQTQDDNLIKYWNYRDRLRKRFIVVSQNVMDYGVNIPASDIFYGINKGYISWGDGNNNMSHYLSMLSTELWLLKHNNQDYSQTLRELLYAMMALERLDTYSESNIRWKSIHGFWEHDLNGKNYVQAGDINGFSLRNDVTDDFWKKYGSHFDVLTFQSNFSSDNTSHFMEENSQDVIEHTMEGLGLVSKLVGTESVVNIPCDWSDINVVPRLIQQKIVKDDSIKSQHPTTIDFSLWAKDIVKRYIRYMQYDGTYNVGVNLPIFGNTTLFSTHWILINPVTQKCVQEGSGNMSTYLGVSMISSGIIKAGEAIAGENLRLYPGLFTNCEFKIAFKRPEIFMLGKEDNLVRSLACTGNLLGNKTFSVLRRLRDNYNPYKKERTLINEHLPLMYLTLHSLDAVKLDVAVYNSEKALYEQLLNIAPFSGPASNCGIHSWSSTSRCLWPNNLGKNTDTHTDYNGLDYMMLHNLYCITFCQTGFKTLDLNSDTVLPVRNQTQSSYFIKSSYW